MGFIEWQTAADIVAAQMKDVPRSSEELSSSKLFTAIKTYTLLKEQGFLFGKSREEIFVSAFVGALRLSENIAERERRNERKL